MDPRTQAKQTTDFLRDVLDDEPFIEKAGRRVLSDGADQYYDRRTDKMRFETMDVGELSQYLEEELLDAVNYLYMIWVRSDGRLNVDDFVYDLWDISRRIDGFVNEEPVPEYWEPAYTQYDLAMQAARFKIEPKLAPKKPRRLASLVSWARERFGG